MRPILKAERKYDEYLASITKIFTMSRWFGIPVYGGKRFLCMTILILSMLAAIEVAALWKLIRAVAGYANNNLTTDNRGVTARLSGAIFYGNSLVSLLLSWRLINRWKRSLSKYWLRLETKSELYVKPDASIKLRVTVVSSFVACCALMEHMLSMMAATGFECPPSEYFFRYILSSHGFMLQPYEYSLWVAIPICLTSKFATILWNFQDLIVILISMGLTSRYHRLNLFVKRFVGQYPKGHQKNGLKISSTVHKWRLLREAYVQQAGLVRKVDKELGVLLVLCNLNNFYFICLQLFLGLRKSEGSMINRIYYFVSLGWLLFRASSVVLAAADVHFHSQRALPALCSCSSSGYNVEIKRLKYQLINDDVILTGMGLFLLNRQKLLEVAAAIVKYELILIQYEK